MTQRLVYTASIGRRIVHNEPKR